MRAHPTDPSLPSFYLGAAVDQLTMIIDGSTIHVVLAPDDACVAGVAEAMQTLPPSLSYLLVEIDDGVDATHALHWQCERKDASGNRHILQVAESIENVRAEYSGHSESSIGVCTEHVLAAGELARFGLTSGLLIFEGTRTVQVWRAHPTMCGASTSVTRLFSQAGVHCYLWLHPVRDDVEGTFPMLDDHRGAAS